VSSINPHFSLQYSQPEEYRFSHDSVFLARRVFEHMSEAPLRPMRVLDLCSGCGIVGLDFLFHCRKERVEVPEALDFLEVQSVYEEHFEKNVQALGLIDTKLRFLNSNYTALIDKPAAYDLILCNPPYFLSNQGKLSPSEFKGRCRFFLDADPLSLFQAAAASLRRGGRAYVLIRDPDLVPEAIEGCVIQPFGEIRGTPLIELLKEDPANA
jgi:tRNA1Val (adenine37-N6)-methyltransferase